MAQTVHLELTANGTKIDGESDVSSLDRDKTIQCLTYDDSVIAHEAGNKDYGPIQITKRIDKSSPLLNKALTNNEKIEGTFRFYRPSPSGDGTEQHFFTVKITKGRIQLVTRSSPDAESGSEWPFEMVGITFGDVTYTYEDGGIEHQDTFREKS